MYRRVRVLGRMAHKGGSALRGLFELLCFGFGCAMGRCKKAICEV